MKKEDLRIICFFEGIQIPVLSINMISVRGLPVTYNIELPAVKEVDGIPEGTQVESFVYDNDSKVYRLFFRAHSVAKTYSKGGGRKRRGISAIGNQAYLNRLPNKYLSLLDGDMFKDLAYKRQFYHIPIQTYVKYKSDKMITGSDLGFMILPPMNELKDIDEEDLPTLVKYFNGFLKLMSESWEPFFKNLNERLDIKKNHVFVDEKLFKRWYDAKRVVRILKSANGSASRINNFTVLDYILGFLEKIGYSYIVPLCPVYKKEKSAGDADRDYTVNHESNMLAEYTLVADFLNGKPPRCNYIESEYDSSIESFIVAPQITRLCVSYSVGEDYSLEEKYAPPEIRHKKIPNTNGELLDMALTEEEMVVGIKPLIITEGYLYNTLLSEKIKESDVAYKLFQKIADFEFATRRHINNTVSVTTSSFDPYIVAGLPGIIHDKSSSTYFYGMVDRHSINININNGSVTTNVKLVKAYEIESFEDLEGMNPYLLKASMGGEEIDNYYKTMLSSDNHPENTVPPFDENKEQEKLREQRHGVYENRKDGYKTYEKLGDYKSSKRDNVTFGEYVISRGIVDKPGDVSEWYEAKYRGMPKDILSITSEPEKFILSKEDNATYSYPDGRKHSYGSTGSGSDVYKNKKGNIYMDYIRESVISLKKACESTIL